MVPLGGIALNVDGSDVELPETLAYRGMLLSGVPNMAFAFGYTNQSWTLGADLTSEQVCALITHMDRRGYAHVHAAQPDPAISGVPFADLTSGYIARAIDEFPRQGSKDPWRRQQNYARNRMSMRRAPIDDAAPRVLARGSDRRRNGAERRLSRLALAAGESPALIAHWAAKARSYAGRASPRAT